MVGTRVRANLAAAHHPWELARPSQPVSSWRMPTGSAPPLPGPPNSPTGDPAAKLHFWIRDYRGQNLSLGTKYPLSGALLRAGRPAGGNGHTHPWGAPLSWWNPGPRAEVWAPPVLWSNRGAPADSRFSWSRRLGPTPLRLFLIRLRLGGSRSPWRAARALREGSLSRLRADTANAPSVYTALEVPNRLVAGRPGKSSERWLGVRVMGRRNKGEQDR